MPRFLILIVLLLVPHSLVAGDRVSATNFYVLNQEDINVGGVVFWQQDNAGTFKVSEGAIEAGFVRCLGSGFDFDGGGICIYGTGPDTFTMRWKVTGFGMNRWHIIDATGKYAGMRGHGTTKTRVKSKFLKLKHRVSDWVGEIELPERN